VRLADFHFEDVHLDLAHRLEKRTLPHLGGAFDRTLLFLRTARFRLAWPALAAAVVVGVVVGLAMGITTFTHNFTFSSGGLLPSRDRAGPRPETATRTDSHNEW
jgi:hypothetical protein